MLKLIVCWDKNQGIGKNNQLPWNVKEEMAHFRKTTENATVVMGRKTYESIGRLLPNRENIIFSNNKDYKVKGAKVTNNVESILKLAQTKDVFIIGGLQIYKLFIDHCDELIISQLNKAYECDTFWNINLNRFTKKEVVKHNEFKVTYYQNNKDKILDGKKTSDEMVLGFIKQKNQLVKKYNVIPKLVIICIGNDYGSSVYVRNKKTMGDKIGIDVQLVKQDKITQQELLNLINKFNKDKKVHGILVQHPLPKNIDENVISSAISPIKDVDCFHPENIGNFFKDVNSEFVNSIPCTPLGIIELLKHYNVPMSGKKAVVVGRSNIVGKPMALLLLNENATVKICHSRTKDLIKETKDADILVSAVGVANFITPKHIKKGAVVVDVGMNRSEAGLCGDVDFVGCLPKASLITPVPKGVGPMTLTMLFSNLLHLYEKQLKTSK